MPRKGTCLSVAAFLVLSLITQGAFMPQTFFGKTGGKSIGLPEIERGEPGSFSDLMHRRRSLRRFDRGRLSLEQVSKLLFAAQGVTRKNRFRTVPSAGALYPLEVFVVTGPIQGLEPGVYKYRPQRHELVQIVAGDRRRELAREAFGQMWVAEAQAIMVICAVFERVTRKYGDRGVRYVHIEAGCAAQNVSLQGYRIGLGSTVVGAFSDSGVAEVIKANSRERPLILMPLGLIP